MVPVAEGLLHHLKMESHAAVHGLLKQVTAQPAIADIIIGLPKEFTMNREA